MSSSSSSFSVRFASPLLPSPAAATSARPKTWRVHATTPTVAPVTTWSAPEVDAERLEPRVEERDGYFVLKEKFRKGINPQEKVKIEKEPMKLFMVENGIEDLAKLSMEEIDQAKNTKDDIDVRLKWLGLFHRRKHHCKFPLIFVLFVSFLMYIDVVIILEVETSWNILPIDA